MNKCIICNLKANKTLDEIVAYKKEIDKIELNDNKLIICPPYIYSYLFKDAKYEIGAQDVSKYHCGSLINQIMKCIKCRGILYLDLPTKQLVCLNKKCNFNSKPEAILWKCFICSKDFRSKAKVYNTESS